MFVQQCFQQPAYVNNLAGATTGDGDDAGDSLEDLAQEGRDLARQRLREQLKRDPTEEEVNEWLRQQTEGY